MDKFVDAVIEAPIVSSFSRVGYEVRTRLEGWGDACARNLDGSVFVVTGATSGIGLAAAQRLAVCGATLVLNGRSEEKNARIVAELVASTGNERISSFAADMGERDQVRAFANHVLDHHDRVDVLIHNAGALSSVRRENSSGLEATVASQVVGPFLLTSLLAERLKSTGGSRVLTMSSGGMYGAALSVRGLEMSAEDYNGTQQYAKAKRAQVTLNEMWASRHTDIAFHALHPGWVDTPGVDDALPGFARIMGPLLRTPDQGADTLLWLACDPEPASSSGVFWHDRRPRRIHKLPSTRRSDTAEKRHALWEWVEAAALAA